VTEQEVTLTVEQANRFHTIQAAVEGRLNNAAAAAALRLSVRQVRRLKRKVEARGPTGIVHGNAGREPPNKTPPDLQAQVVELATTRYADCNFSHLADLLVEDHGIVLSDETLRRWLRAVGHGRPKRRVKVHRRRRTRRPRAGELLFLDGSPHPWFGDAHPSCCLLLASDDATGRPLRGLFLPTENRDGCFEVCYGLFRKHGLPAGFYLDRASQFTTTRHGGLHVRQGPDTEPTHFEKAMARLAVGLIFAHSPQARGRGERLNGSFQDRLVQELALHGITDMAEATRYLNRRFIPRYARRFGRAPADPSPAWRPVPQGMDLRAELCAHHTRTVAHDHTVQFQGGLWQLKPPQDAWHLVRAQVDVQERFDGSLRFWHAGYGYLCARCIEEPAP